MSECFFVAEKIMGGMNGIVLSVWFNSIIVKNCTVIKFVSAATKQRGKRLSFWALSTVERLFRFGNARQSSCAFSQLVNDLDI